MFLEQSGKWAFISDPLPLSSCIWDVFPSDLFLSCSFTSSRSIFKCHLLKDLSRRPNKTQHSAHSLLCCLFLYHTCNHHLVLCVSAHCSTPSLTGACLPLYKTQHSAHSLLCCLFLHHTCNHHLVLCVSAHCSTPITNRSICPGPREAPSTR